MYTKLCWVCKKISWYLCILTAIFAFASAKFLWSVLEVNNALDGLLSNSTVQILGSDTSQWIMWALRLTCVVTIVTITGAFWNIGSRLHCAAVKERFVTGIVLQSTCCCSTVPVSRLVVNVNHALAIVSTAWFGALLCGTSAFLNSFRSAENLASTARFFQPTDQQNLKADISFFKDTQAWLMDTDGQVGGILSDIDTYCTRLQCGATVIDAMEVLRGLQAEVSELATSMSAVGAGLCPTAACVNAELFTFCGTSASGCICSPEAVTSLHTDASEGQKSCESAMIWAAAAFGAAILLLSAAAMSLKSLVKDQHWMNRFNMLAGELTAKGISPQNSMYNLLDEGSLSHYPIRQPPCTSEDLGRYASASSSKGRHLYAGTAAPQKPTGMLARESLDAEGSGEDTLKAVGGRSGRWGNTWDAPNTREINGQPFPTVVPVPPPRV